MWKCPIRFSLCEFICTPGVRKPYDVFSDIKFQHISNYFVCIIAIYQVLLSRNLAMFLKAVQILLREILHSAVPCYFEQYELWHRHAHTHTHIYNILTDAAFTDILIFPTYNFGMVHLQMYTPWSIVVRRIWSSRRRNCLLLWSRRSGQMSWL